MGGYKCQLSVKISAICQLSVNINGRAEIGNFSSKKS